MPLQQSLMGRGEEREPRQEVLVVDFYAFGKPGRRIAGNDQD
jgi:hypothetical protein